MAPRSLWETLKAQSLLRAPFHLLLLRPRGWPLVAVEAHVAAQPLLCVEHLAAVLADESAPRLRPVTGASVLLGTAGRGETRQEGLGPHRWLFLFAFFFSKSDPLTTLDEP